MSKARLPERTKWISQTEFREKYRVSDTTELRMRDELKLETFKFHSIVYYDDLQVQRTMTENSTYALKP